MALYLGLYKTSDAARDKSETYPFYSFYFKKLLYQNNLFYFQTMFMKFNYN